MNLSKLLRTLTLVAITLVAAAMYYSYAAAVSESREFKNPAGANTTRYHKGKFTYSLAALPSRMSYYLLPPYADFGDVQYPLLVVLHGGTGKAYAGGFMAEDYYRQKYPGYVLVPVTPPGHIWASPAADPAPYKNALPYVAALVKRLSASLPIDKGRIYVIGCSMGGGGSIAASLYYQDIFAAAVAVAGYFSPNSVPANSDTPLWIFHGLLDTDAPVEAARAAAYMIRQAGGTVYYTEWKSYGHNCPAEYFYPEQMWDWLYSQTKPRLRI